MATLDRDAAAARAEILSIESGRMLVLASEPVRLGAPVRVDCGDVLALGEVLDISASNGRYRVTVTISEFLTGEALGSSFNGAANHRC